MMTDDGRTDGRTTDAGVTGILIAHLGAFGSGELKIQTFLALKLSDYSMFSKTCLKRPLKRRPKIVFKARTSYNAD